MGFLRTILLGGKKRKNPDFFQFHQRKTLVPKFLIGVRQFWGKQSVFGTRFSFSGGLFWTPLSGGHKIWVQEIPPKLGFHRFFNPNFREILTFSWDPETFLDTQVFRNLTTQCGSPGGFFSTRKKGFLKKGLLAEFFKGEFHKKRCSQNLEFLHKFFRQLIIFFPGNRGFFAGLYKNLFRGFSETNVWPDRREI